MKTFKYLLPLFVLALGFQSVSARKKVVKAAKLTAAKVDTVSLADFCYAMGLAQSDGLKPYLVQRMGVDTAYLDEFVRGLKEVMADPKNPKLNAYSAGLQIGGQVYGQMVPNLNQQITGDSRKDTLNMGRFNQGFLDGLNGKGTLTRDSAAAIVGRQMQYYNDRLMEIQYGKNRIEGENFLKANAKKDSVKTLPSGVQYKVLKAGTGEMPKADQRVKVHYEGRLIDGKVFDSSYKRGEPTTFACNQVIKGWTEALTHMPVGSTWEVYIPQQLAYGSRNMGTIPPLSTLIFKIELIEIVK